MTRSIWKFQIPFPATKLDPTFIVTLPRGWKFLTVQIQNDLPMIWFEVEPKAPMAAEIFVVTGTGHPFDDNRIYLGTWQEAPYVWHLYRIGE